MTDAIAHQFLSLGLRATSTPQIIRVLKHRGLDDLVKKKIEDEKIRHLYNNPLQDGKHSYHRIAKIR